MNLLALELARYGHFADRRLAFPEDGPNLHFLVGRNEAGKSTALAALGDLLFGIPARTPYGFRHGYAAMRIGAEIATAAGERIVVQRKKGNANTLLDASGTAISESVLQRALGNVDRGFFERMFGLDQDRLRKGGQALLTAQGDAGQVLFGSGAGIADVGAILRGLEEEADRLVGRRAGSGRPFFQALERRRIAQQQQRAAVLSGDDWRALQARKAETGARITAAREALHTLEAARARNERLKRVRPLVLRLDAVEAALAQRAGQPPLPAAAAAAWPAARAERQAAAAELAARAEEQARLATARQEVPPEDPIRLHRDAVTAVFQEIGDDRRRAADLPKQTAAAQALGLRVTERLRSLGIVDEGARSAPGRPLADRIRRLAADDARIADARAALERESAVLTASRAETGALLSALGEPQDPAPLAGALAQGGGDLAQRLVEAETLLDRQRSAVVQGLQQAGWRGEADAFVALVPPDERAIAMAEQALQAAGAALLEQDRAAAAAANLSRQTALELDALEAEGDVPTPAATQALRRRRDAAWGEIRQRWLGGAPGDPELAASFEAATGAADAIADRRIGEQERVARYELALQRQRSVRREAEAIALKRTEAEARLAEQRKAWQALWPAEGIAVGEPRTMLSWLERRRGLLGEIARTAEQAAVVQRLAAAAADVRALLSQSLAAVGTPVDPVMTLPALAATAERRLASLSAAATERRALLLRQAAETRTAQELADRQAVLSARATDWRMAWTEAMAEIGLSAETPADAALHALATWEEIEADLIRREDADHRARRMAEESAKFADRVFALVPVAPELAGLAPRDAAAGLFARLQAADAAAERRRTLEERLDSVGTAHARAAERMRRADSAAAALLTAAEAEDDAAMERRLADAAEDERRRADRESLLAQLLQQGDGLPTEMLRADVAASDPDTIEADNGRIKAELAERDVELMSLGELRERIAAEEQTISRSGGAIAAAEAVEAANADLCTIADQFIRARTAALLLRRAIEQYRSERQGPLIARAGSLFGALTCGSFDRLGVDYDDDDRPTLVALRREGERVAVEGLSEGSRDQLYLSLRLASIESYLAAAEPLPLVCDDLLVSFDDPRCTAAFQVLDAIAARTQVLFFTHHPHLADLAQRTLGQGRCTVTEL